MSISIELTELIIASILYIVWLARLEFVSKQNRLDIEKLYFKHEALEKEIVEKLSDLLVSVAEIKGQLINNDSNRK